MSCLAYDQWKDFKSQKEDNPLDYMVYKDTFEEGPGSSSGINMEVDVMLQKPPDPPPNTMMVETVRSENFADQIAQLHRSM